MLTKYAKVYTEDRLLNQVQENAGKIFNEVSQFPLFSGVLLQNVELSSGSNSSTHGLGRALVGWVITRNRASSTIFDTQDNNSLPAATLLLTASADTNVDIYVF